MNTFCILNSHRVPLCAKKRDEFFSHPSLFNDSQRLEPNRALSHTARCSNRRQECRERSYYHLHRQLNHTLFFHYLPPFCALSIYFSPEVRGSQRGSEQAYVFPRSCVPSVASGKAERSPPLAPPNSGGETDTHNAENNTVKAMNYEETTDD